MMRIAVASLAALLCLSGCASGKGQAPISEASAISAGLTAVVDLDRHRAETSSTAVIVGFRSVKSYEVTDPASVVDSQGNRLTLDQPPSNAWVEEYTAPPQARWSSISALAVIDSSTGVVRGTGLWPVPSQRAQKAGA